MFRFFFEFTIQFFTTGHIVSVFLVLDGRLYRLLPICLRQIFATNLDSVNLGQNCSSPLVVGFEFLVLNRPCMYDFSGYIRNRIIQLFLRCDFGIPDFVISTTQSFHHPGVHNWMQCGSNEIRSNLQSRHYPVFFRFIRSLRFFGHVQYRIGPAQGRTQLTSQVARQRMNVLSSASAHPTNRSIR